MTEEQKIYYTGVLLARAIDSRGFGISPVCGNRQFRSGLIIHGKSIYLYYNYEDNNTATVSIPLEN